MVDLEKGFYNSPRWSYEITDCSMPMTFDTYSNCAFQCVYCFSFFQRSISPTKGAYLSHKVSAVNVEKIKRMFTDPDKHGGQFAWYIKARKVMQWGGLSDGFDYYEKKFGRSLELLRFFKEIGYPISISTKGIWYLKDKRYIDVLKGAENFHFKLSIITADKKAAKLIERGVPPPDERFKALRRLNELGVSTTLRFRPYIPFVSDKTWPEMIDQAAKANCGSVTTEWLCLESRATSAHLERYAVISKVAGVDLWEYYKRNSQKKSGLLRLNYEAKRPVIEAMRKRTNDLGMHFFVSDCHHAEKTPHPNCCGVPDKGVLANYCEGHFKKAILIAKEKGRVQWKDISEAAEPFKAIGWVNATGLNKESARKRAERKFQSLYGYLRDRWNSPKSYLSPGRYFGGVLVADGIDDEDNVIYLYNFPFVDSGQRVKSVAELRSKVDERTK
ncbi:hypothetical protein LCGC14_1775720 [marine sediment metagenome]|uniref:Elp3/MiaA/NifB-like radical SAM core domain-containing protein n=1 Tax=marine sediment metagenome TaxID=412755 RepID=A0A0F9GX42_9ZZZZ